MLIILLRVRSSNRKLKKIRVLEYLGKRSFGIYLYHWPLYIVCNKTIQLGYLGSFVALFLSLILAEFSYRFVENGFRKKLQERSFTLPRSRVAFAAIGITLCLFSTSVVSFASAPEKNSIQLDL